mmetsp:Transcript_126563/g.369828  ORF Transcript_126563/g.369828 Transcript_126563/m.369828 type:complete len:398 (+) Transcript_126563:78-1271(+)
MAASPVGEWRFRGQVYVWDPDTYNPDENDNPVAKTLFDPKFQPLLDKTHGEYDTKWDDEFVGPFMKEIFLHGCAFWVLLPLFVLLTSLSVSCVGGPSPLLLFLLGGLLIGFSVAHEAKMLSYKQTYYNINDIYAPARLARGLDTLSLQYGYSVLKQLGFATYGLLIPQVFACGDAVAERYVQLWRDSFVRVLAVPLFEHATFGFWVVAIYVGTVLIMQGVHGWTIWRDKCDGDGLAADVEALADWAGMAALSSAFRRLNNTDIQGQASMGAPEAIMRTREGELTELRKIRNSIITVSVPQIYISLTLMQLTFDLKSHYGQLVVAGTSFLSLASAMKSSWPGTKFIMDDYRRVGQSMFAATVMVCMLGAYKLAGAFVCESHLTALFPPHCVFDPHERP